jgi:preprotein translocase subunit SecG
VSDLTLNYIFAMVVAVLILIVGVLVQNWWDARRG